MKKLLILALVVLVAGAAFAETDPVFSGSFSTYWAFPTWIDGGNEVDDDNSVSMSIDLGATIDDYNTVSVSVGMADALYWDDIYDNDVIEITSAGAGAANGGTSVQLGDGDDELKQQGNYLRLDSFTLSTDLTGALGVAGPVAVTTTMGDFAFGTVNVANVAPKSVDLVGGSGADGGIGLGVSASVLDMVTIGTVFYPESAIDNQEGETGVTLSASGIADMIDVAVFFMASEWDLSTDAWNIDGDPNDDEGLNMGASVAVDVIDGVKVGAGFAYDMTNRNSDGDKGKAAMQMDVAVSMIEALTLGVSYGTKDLTDFVKASRVRVSAKYDLMDNLGLFAAVGLNDFYVVKEDIRYDAGITTSLASLAVTLGASNDLDYMAPEDDFDDVVYVNFSTSF